MRNIPALDGLRAFAILLVVLFHAQSPAHGGFIGVDVFFVLSGFLITSLLLAELGTTGQLRLGKFYERRALRLMPALLTMLAVYAVVAPLIWPQLRHVRDALLAATYLSDYSVALTGYPDVLTHTWSLAIEAHFYLLWPLIVLVGYRRLGIRGTALGLAGLYAIATLWRVGWVFAGQDWASVYYRFDTRLSGLVLGSLVATSLHDDALKARLQRWFPASLWWIVVWAVIIYAFRWGSAPVQAFGFTLVEWASAALLLAALGQGSLQQWLAHPVLVWLGQMSYGVYLWHYPVFRYLREVLPWSGTLLIGVPISLGMAALSFYTVETWARRRRAQVRVQSAVGREAIIPTATSHHDSVSPQNKPVR